MSDIEVVRKYEPEAQPLYPPAAVCIGVHTTFRRSEIGRVRGTKTKVRRWLTDFRSRVLSDDFWREGDGHSWEQAHSMAWKDAAEKIRDRVRGENA